MNYKLLLIMLLGLFLISFTSAFLGYYDKDTCVDIKTILNSSGTTISSINFPNMTKATGLTPMTKSGLTFNYTFCSTQTIGNYVYDYNDSEGNVYENYFTIGKELSTATGLVYFIVTLFACGVFLLMSWVFLNIEGENPKDATGYLGINYRKYIKTALFPLVYVSFLWFFNLIVGLSVNYLKLTLYENTLGFIFMILTKLIFPIIAITIIVELILMVKDSNIKKEYQSLWNQS